MQSQYAGVAGRSRRPDHRNRAISVSPDAAEVPLRIVLMITGSVLWIAFVVSIIGLVYGIVLGLVFFFVQLSLIAHIRGSSIKLGPQQLPELYERVDEIAQRIGMKTVPDVYLRQSGGVLNAFATRFGRARFVVLFSDLVEACGDNVDALDFIIAHELGHIHRGHLNWRWLLAPAMFIPFLGTAYSRACEFTCDRYGFAAPSDPIRSLDGLCILAAGPQYAAMVDMEEFAAQSRDLDTVFMKLGGWFATHPPLAQRIAALDFNLETDVQGSTTATVGALLVAVVIFVVPLVGGAFALKQVVDDAVNKFTAQTGAGKGSLRLAPR
jgi:Zn-dependent protease with chaperone function